MAIDDWLLAPLKEPERRDLMEVIGDRAERASTLIASQLPIKDWHAVIGDPNQADALCDQLLHNAHRIELKGPSMRQTQTAQRASTTEGDGALPGHRGRTTCGQGVNVAASGDRVDNRGTTRKG